MVSEPFKGAPHPFELVSDPAELLALHHASNDDFFTMMPRILAGVIGDGLSPKHKTKKH